MNIRIALSAALAAALLSPSAARAAGSDELWEVSTKMEMPDMPEMSQLPPGVAERMGGGTVQVCRSKDVRDEIKKNKRMEDCTVSDFKESATKVTMSMKCKGGRTAKAEYDFNSGRTSYKGTMHMHDPEHGDMTMRMSGKKIGSCDAAKTKAEREERVAAIKSQSDKAQADYKNMMKQSQEKQISDCRKAVTTMDPNLLGYLGTCYKSSDPSCKSLASLDQQQPEVAKACKTKAAELCKRFESEDGFMTAKEHGRVDAVERMCRVKAEDVRPGLCKSALRAEHWDFVGAFCPDDAKPLAKKHCAGKSYTVKEGDPRRVEKKWFSFCKAMAGSYASGDESTEEEAPAPKKKRAKTASEAVKDEAVDQGLNKLKGLFGH